MNQRFYVDLGKELSEKVDNIARELHFTGRRNVIAVLVREFEENRK